MVTPFESEVGRVYKGWIYIRFKTSDSVFVGSYSSRTDGNKSGDAFEGSFSPKCSQKIEFRGCCRHKIGFGQSGWVGFQQLWLAWEIEMNGILKKVFRCKLFTF